jgi:hypothetical protein
MYFLLCLLGLGFSLLMPLLFDLVTETRATSSLVPISDFNNVALAFFWSETEGGGPVGAMAPLNT